jgi:hypothetical protein
MANVSDEVDFKLSFIGKYVHAQHCMHVAILTPTAE